jgi:Zn finger protein HypA/HybF involved in hydrogenase expression
MHEMHLIKDMFADILRLAAEQGAKKITKVHLRMGEFTEINEEIVKFFFREKSRGTILESAELAIEKSKARELTLLSFDCE